MIDRDAPDPPWVQLAAILRSRIASGEITSRLPGERALHQEFGLAPVTIRKAVRQLRDEGLVRTTPGWGTYVVKKNDDTGARQDLSVSHNKVGDVAMAAGDLAAARAAYQASQDIAARLAAADPANTQWQRDLSISHNRLGDVAMAAGDLAAARAAYQASQDIRVRLAAADPANAQWQRDLEAIRRKISSLDA